MDEKTLREACEMVAGMTFGEWEAFKAIVEGMVGERYNDVVSRAFKAADYWNTRLDCDELFDRMMHGEASASGT